MLNNKKNNIEEIVNKDVKKEDSLLKRILLSCSLSATYIGVVYTVQYPFSRGEIDSSTLYIAGGFFLTGLIYSTKKE